MHGIAMNDNAELLKQLRIERNQPEKKTPGPLQVVIPLAIAGVVLLSIAIAWWLLRDGGGPEVRTAQAAPLSSGPSAASVLDASGYVVARRMATVSAKVTGRVQEVLIEEGMRVEEGQVLARLDPVDADASRALATSQLAAARSQIDNVQAQLVEAEANATRLQKLVGNQLVSRAQYDQAVAQRDSLRAQLATVRRQAQVAQDQLRIAGHGVDNTVVRAPFSGVVIARPRSRARSSRRWPPAASPAPASAPSSTWIRWRSRSTWARPTSAGSGRRCRWKRRSTPIRTGRSRPR